MALLRKPEISQEQASRCMDCGTPFCHWGCPVGNVIPEWNDLIYKGKWQQAIEILQSTNNFPEVTGRVCPALCEAGCVLAINDDAVTIRENELAIVEYAFEKGYIKANPPKNRTGKKVAVIGSGPAGLACADQLNKAGHTVTVFEKYDRVGGILRYGIPDFKLEKNIIDRRIDIMKAEGIDFKVNTDAGVDVKPEALLKDYDAIALCGGSRLGRDLPIEGRKLDGIYLAMDFLTQYNRIINKDAGVDPNVMNAKGKRVVVIGGGDTGNDCVGVSHREGAKSVLQLEVMPKPPEKRTPDMPWPTYPRLHKNSTSHEEGGERDWCVLSKRFVGENGKLTRIECVRINWEYSEGRQVMREIPGSEFTIEADIVVLAMGFVQPEHNGLLDGLGVDYDARGNVKTDVQYRTSVPKVFSAGDMHRGQSLVVWAIMEGRDAAMEIDKELMGSTTLKKSGYKCF